MTNKKLPKETKLKIQLLAFYIFLIIGFLAPLVNHLWGSNPYEKLLKLFIPALAAISAVWFQKSAAQLVQECAAFAIPGTYELRQKYLLHVNHLEWALLILAIYVLGWSVL